MRSKSKNRWMILAVLALSILGIILSSSAIGIALPSIQKNLSATMQDLQWTMNAYLLVFASLMLPAGWLADRIGTKPVFIAGLAIFAASNAVALLVSQPWELIILRGIMGLGAAMILPVSLAILNDVFPEAERGKAIAVWAGMNSIGVALGPIAGGALVQYHGWISIFLINLPVTAVAILAAGILLPNNKAHSTGGIDGIGILSSGLGLAFIFNGLTRSGSEGWGEAGVIFSLVTGTCLIVFFLLWELQHKAPLFPLAVFQIREYSSSIVSLAIMSLSLVGITFALSLYMQFVAGHSPIDAGIRLLPLALGIFFGAGLASRFVKLFGSPSIITGGFLGIALASLAFAMMDESVHYAFFGLALFLLSFFFGCISAPATTNLMASLPKAQAAAGSAMSNIVRTAAGAIGVAVLGSILSQTYSAGFLDSLQHLEAAKDLPEAMRTKLAESIGATLAIAEGLPEPLQGEMVLNARHSFMRGWNLVAWISFGLSLCGAMFSFLSKPRAKLVPQAEAGVD